jgi:hypothetical protein
MPPNIPNPSDLSGAHPPMEELPVCVCPATQTNLSATCQSACHTPYPSTVPPQVSPAIASTTHTRRPNQSPAEICADEASLALKQQEKANKAASKAAETRLKATQKATQDLIKANSSIHLKWILESSLELLHFVRMERSTRLQIRNNRVSFGSPSISKLYTDRKDEFPLIKDINNKAFMRRYQALMNTYRVSQLWFLLVISCQLTQLPLFSIASARLG